MNNYRFWIFKTENLMMGSASNMNAEEEKAIKELKMRIGNELTPVMSKDSSLFYRFLKARDLDVDKAEKMLRKHIIWRKMQQVDTILEDFTPSELFVKYFNPSLIGYDKKGDMLLYYPTGTYDIHEIRNSIKLNNFMKHWTWFAEQHLALQEENNVKTGKHRHRASLIINLDKLAWKNVTSKFTLDVLLRFVHMYQDNYPERMKCVFVINISRYFYYIYSILKTVMSPVSVKKFRIFGQDGYKEALLEFIDPDVLPAFLGGNRTDPDGNPLCLSFINHDGKIPEKYFLTDEDRYFQSNTQVRKITVSKQQKEDIYVDVKEVGLLIKWEFFVENNDIGFGLYWRNSENEREEVIPIQRCDTSDGTEIGSYRCPTPGKYILVFDNSYSWFNSKTVEYSIDVER